MSNFSNTEINKALENNEFDKAINLYLKTKNEDREERLQGISAAIELSNQNLSEKSYKKITAAIVDSLQLNPEPEWAKNAYNFINSSLSNLNFSNKDKASYYKTISNYMESLSPNSGKQGYNNAGNEYHLMKQYELAREVYNKAQNYDKSYMMFTEEVNYNFGEYNISDAVKTLEKLIDWNKDKDFITRDEIFDYWYNQSNKILETLSDTEKFLNIKKKINKEEGVSLLQKSIWEQAIAVEKTSREIWEWYFQQSLALEIITLMDYWVNQAVTKNIFELKELGSFIRNHLDKLSVENLVQYAPLFIRSFQEEKELLYHFAEFLEQSFSTSYNINLQINLVNQIIFLFQSLTDTPKLLWWKFQRATIYYRLKDYENTLKDLEEIGTLSKNNNELINSLGEQFVPLAKKMINLKTFEIAEQVFDIVITMYRSINDSYTSGKILGDEAALLFEHRRKNAPEILKSAITILSGEEYVTLRGEIHQNVGESLFNVGEEDNALNFFKDANKLYLKEKSKSQEQAKSLGTLLEVKSRGLLQDRKRRRLYDKYYDFTESVFQSWDLSDELSKTLVFELKRLIDSKIDPENIATMAEKTGNRLQAHQEIEVFTKMLQNYTDFLIERGDLINASNISTILLSTLEKLNRVELVKKFGVAIAMNFFKIKETIIGEDVLEKAIDAFDQDEEFQDIGDALVDAGYILARVKNHEQAAATLGRAIPYYEDANNPKKIEDTIAKCLEIAKKLSDQGKEDAHLYINKANDIMNQTGVKLSETITETVYSSYSEHLLTKTEEIIKEKYVPKRKRKKREFNIFKKKTEEF
ncbi:MAG: hypothetical protein ACW98A_00390 [Candidatus Hodarchaeales archaeon]|jgi:hypothetical protein